MDSLYPLLLTPQLKTRPWGGRRLATEFGKHLPDDQPYGESWELHDTCKVANGALAGRTIGDLLAEYGAALVGAGNDLSAGFPLLVKLLDAHQWLSIQDHPNDEQALALENEPRGKNEAWYFLSAEPGAKLVLGVKPGATREALAEAIRDNRLEAMVAFAEVQEDDSVFMAAGTVHALGPGLIIYEIQQSSDTTYRLYDWGRAGLDGKPRELHIDKGLQVANLGAPPEIRYTGDVGGQRVQIFETPYFITERYSLNETDGLTAHLNTHGSFHSLTCIEGAARAESPSGDVDFALGQTVLIPAALGAYSLSAGDQARILLSKQP
ncbi:MAG: class I mannose-6-phosphate isomerase [Anaerolineae bacterium]|nr:class I mannose-6-phosphate isomerase [Anaerolineae bacterium]